MPIVAQYLNDFGVMRYRNCGQVSLASSGASTQEIVVSWYTDALPIRGTDLPYKSQTDGKCTPVVMMPIRHCRERRNIC